MPPLTMMSARLYVKCVMWWEHQSEKQRKRDCVHCAQYLVRYSKIKKKKKNSRKQFKSCNSTSETRKKGTKKNCTQIFFR